MGMKGKFVVEHNHITIIPETIDQATNSYLIACKSAGLKRNTLEVYKRCIIKLCKFLEGEFGIVRMLDISPDHLRAFFILLQITHNVGGIEVYYRPIKAFVRWYWDEYEMPGRPPIARVKVNHAKATPKPGITREEVESLYNACKTHLKDRDRAMILGLIDTCARATEFCQLRVGDVDFITGHARIRVGKGGKSRSVRFTSRTMKHLRRYLKNRGSLIETDPLFANDEGHGFLDRFSLRLMINRRAEDAGISHHGIHDFRRCGAYEMWKRTHDIKAVSLYLGHSNVLVTQRYLAITDDDVLETVEIYNT